MTTVRCKICSKEFTKPTAEKAEQALRMHDWRMHSHRVPTATPAQRMQRSQERLALATTNRPLVADGRRRRSLMVEAHTEPACFCPRCGLNLVVLNTAMHVASNMSPVSNASRA